MVVLVPNTTVQRRRRRHDLNVVPAVKCPTNRNVTQWEDPSMTLNVRRFRTNLLLPSLGRSSRRPDEIGWMLGQQSTRSPSLPPTRFLLFLPSLGSSKFVRNLRKLTPVSKSGQNGTCLVVFLHNSQKKLIRVLPADQEMINWVVCKQLSNKK